MNFKQMIPAVHFVGKSGTGKTTLIETVVQKLKERGYRVAVIKHAHHGFEMDKPGKDSWRFGQAGSDMVGGAAGYCDIVHSSANGKPTDVSSWEEQGFNDVAVCGNNHLSLVGRKVGKIIAG